MPHTYRRQPGRRNDYAQNPGGIDRTRQFLPQGGVKCLPGRNLASAMISNPLKIKHISDLADGPELAMT
jgi:hypothetical protein